MSFSKKQKSGSFNVVFLNYISRTFYVAVKGLICYEMLRKLSKMADDVKEQILSKELFNHAEWVNQYV